MTCIDPQLQLTWYFVNAVAKLLVRARGSNAAISALHHLLPFPDGCEEMNNNKSTLKESII